MCAIKLINNTIISEEDLCTAHYQLLELITYFLTQYPDKLSLLREAIVDNAIQKLPKNTVKFMHKKNILTKNNTTSSQIRNVCESYLNKDGSFKKTFLK